MPDHQSPAVSVIVRALGKTERICDALESLARQSRDDFEVVLFDGSNPLRYAAYMTAVTLRQVKSMPGVMTLRSRRVAFSGDAHLQIDGEYGGRIPATLEMLPDALTLLAPAAYR